MDADLDERYMQTEIPKMFHEGTLKFICVFLEEGLTKKYPTTADSVVHMWEQ